jgi:hypothetical protein
MRRLAAIVTVSAALLVAGCGSDSESSQPTIVGGSPETTAEAPGTTVDAPDTTMRSDTTQAPSKDGVTADDLKPMLLTTADLPAGWTAEPADDDDDDSDDSDAPECFQAITRQVTPAEVPDVEADFTQGDFPVLFQRIGYLGDEAAERFEIVTTGLSQCTDLTLPAGQGQVLTGTITPLPFPSLGDESAAYRMAFDFQGLPLTFDVSLTRIDGAVNIMLFGDLGATADGQFAPIAQAAVAKIQSGLN